MPLGPGHTWSISIRNHRGIIPSFLTPIVYFIGMILKFAKGLAES